QRQVLPRQFDESLLPEPVDLVVVAVGARGVDVRLRGAATVEEPLREVGLIAAALSGVSQHLELPLQPDQLVEALLDRVDGREALFFDGRLTRLERETGRLEIVPPVAAVEDELPQD